MQKIVVATSTLALLLGISAVPTTSVAAYSNPRPPNYMNLCGSGYTAPYPVQKTDVGKVFIYKKGYTVCAIHVRSDGKTKYTGISIRRAYSTSTQSSVRYSYRTDPVYSYAGKRNCSYVTWDDGTAVAPQVWNMTRDKVGYYKACV